MGIITTPTMRASLFESTHHGQGRYNPMFVHVAVIREAQAQPGGWGVTRRCGKGWHMARVAGYEPTRP